MKKKQTCRQCVRTDKRTWWIMSLELTLSRQNASNSQGLNAFHTWFTSKIKKSRWRIHRNTVHHSLWFGFLPLLWSMKCIKSVENLGCAVTRPIKAKVLVAFLPWRRMVASFLWKLSGPSSSLKKGFINWVPWTLRFLHVMTIWKFWYSLRVVVLGSLVVASGF